MNYNKTLNLPATKFSMKANLPQREPNIQKFWQENDIYERLLEKNKNSDKFILHDGPPYANGNIHLGHALNRTLKDIVLKYKSMKGFYTPFVPGWDCHGLPVEYELIKNLKKSEISLSTDYDKVNFRRKAAKYALKFVKLQQKEFKRLGLFGDWDNPYLTLQHSYEETIIKTFRELYQDGFIYRELKPVYWCASCSTALAEAEVGYNDITSPSVFVKFKLLKKFADIEGVISALIWTTTPWTLPANVALCFHPDYKYACIKKNNECLIVADEFIKNYEGYEKIASFKGSDFENIEFEHPFNSSVSKGINGNFVTLTEGTGIVHIAPGHGEDDYIIAKKYGLPVLSPVDKEGRWTKDVGIKELEGRKVCESDSLIIEMLKKKNIFFREEKIVHSYPHCWRCKNPVIFRATKQWFLEIDKHNLREKILSEIEKTDFFPAVAIKRITSMLKARPDWCLSRQRLWGVPVPILYCTQCESYVATEESFKKIEALILSMGSEGWFKLTANEILGAEFKCECGCSDFKKGEDILDVWFDSGVSHFAVLEKNKKLNWPADIYIEGSDQHRGWFQTSLITSVALRNIAPYKSVFTHGFIVDADSKKMSKSIGNVVSPQEIIEKYGADLLRLWVANENYFKDIKISDEILGQTVTYYRRIRNTIRFLLGNTGDLKSDDLVNYEDLTSLDKFIMHKFTVMLEEVIENFDNYLFFKSIRNIHDFCNNWLSSFYFNILKDRLYVSRKDSFQRRSSQTVLKLLAENLLKMLAPILSHTAEEGWQNLTNDKESIFLCGFPQVLSQWKNPALNNEWEKLVELRNIVLKSIESAKAEAIIKDPLESAVLISVDAASMSSNETIQFILQKKAEWKEYFIVSKVDIEKKDNLKDATQFRDAAIKVEVKKADGEKCARCWLITDDIGNNSTHPELCSRCVGVINSL